MVRDPVCGMLIDEHSAYATRQLNGVPVYFCSAACVQRFDAAPQRDAPHLVSQEAAPAPMRPLAFGALAILALLAFYLGVITLAQGWSHALEQLGDDRWFIALIALGFGTQVGLFTYLRSLHAQVSTGGVAASTGTSAAGMLACCAHHLSDVLPILGVAGATAFLNAYKTPLLWLGILMNLVGIVYLLRAIRQQRRMACHLPLIPKSTPL